MNDINEQFKYKNLKARLDKLTHIEKVKFAVFSAEQALSIYEKNGKSTAPRLAIEAAKLFIENPSEANKEKCKAAYAADAYDAAAYDAAAYAAYAAYTAYAADADAAYTAYAAADAYADAAREEIKKVILSHLNELESGLSEKMMKTVTHKGKVYTKGHYYADESGRVGILKSCKDGEEFPFVLYTEDAHGSTSWPCTNLVTMEGTFGTIEDAPIELKDGHVYEINIRHDAWHVGYYRGARKSFFTQLVGGNKICAAGEQGCIVHELTRA